MATPEELVTMRASGILGFLPKEEREIIEAYIHVRIAKQEFKVDILNKIWEGVSLGFALGLPASVIGAFIFAFGSLWASFHSEDIISRQVTEQVTSERNLVIKYKNSIDKLKKEKETSLTELNRIKSECIDKVICSPMNVENIDID